MRKLYANVNLLLRKFSKCSVGVKCFLFKTYCSNLYCAPMWFDCTKAALKKLKIAYNNSLRRFIFLPWRNSATEMFANLGIYSFDEMLRIFVFSFRSRVTASHNQLIFGLCTANCSVFKIMGMVEQLTTDIEWHYLSYDLAPCKRILFIVYIFYLTAL